MTDKRDIFEDVKDKLGCEYISDIRIGAWKKEAIRIMGSTDLSLYPLAQLSDMADYLTGEKQSFADCKAAHSFFAAVRT